jgi:hypothetical protein
MSTGWKGWLHEARIQFVRTTISSMLLFGEASNPSNEFYEPLGAEKLFAKSGEFHGGYGRRDLPSLAAKCPLD